MKPIKEDVGRRIKAIRQNGNYSMEAFGKLINNSTRSTVNNWEKGKRTPNQEALEKISILGNTTPGYILYGDLREYVFNLVKQNLHVELNEQSIAMILMAAGPHKLSYYDDVRWLDGVKKILDMGTVEHRRAELVYVLIESTKNLYIGQVYIKDEVQRSSYQGDFKPIYYVYADVEQNTLHVIPFPFNEHKEELFLRPPTFIEEPGKHSYFTNHFDQINLKLEESSLVFYGINRSNLKEDIQLYTYEKQEDCYKCLLNSEINYYSFFKDELMKERLKLEENRGLEN